MANTSWIFFGNIVHAILQYIINIICARAFGTNDYGLINYAASLIAFFTSLATLGFNGIITKKFAEDEEKVGQYLGTGILARFIFSMISIIILQLVVHSSSVSEPIIRTVVFCQSLQITFGTLDLIIYWLRFKNEAKIVAILRLAAFFLSAVWRLIAIMKFHNLIMYVLVVSFETAAFSILLVWFYIKEYSAFRFSFSFNALKTMLKISYPFIFSAILATVYGQTDKIMLKGMLDNTAVAMYSVSQTLAGAIAIIPTALIEGFRPDIMSFKISNQSAYRKRLQQLYGSVFWICIFYCAFIGLFAKPIILILYGNAYIAAVPALLLIVWYTSFSYFGAINNLYMVAENKTVYVQINTLIGAVTNILLNLLLIPRWGIVGAAGASLIIQVIANFVVLYLVKPLREDFFILIQGIRLVGFKDVNVVEIIRKRRG